MTIQQCPTFSVLTHIYARFWWELSWCFMEIVTPCSLMRFMSLWNTDTPFLWTWFTSRLLFLLLQHILPIYLPNSLALYSTVWGVHHSWWRAKVEEDKHTWPLAFVPQMVRKGSSMRQLLENSPRTFQVLPKPYWKTRSAITWTLIVLFLPHVRTHVNGEAWSHIQYTHTHTNQT